MPSTALWSDAVRDAIDSGQVNYDVLIHLGKGRRRAGWRRVESNMAAFNRLRSQIAGEILRRLSEVSTSELSIPVGTLTGSTLLAGRGPCIRVRMQSVGSADASLRNAFSAAGINQTRHQILLHVDVYISILLPGFTTCHQGQQRASPWQRPSLWAACRRHTPISAPLPRRAGAVRPGLHHEQRMKWIYGLSKPR